MQVRVRRLAANGDVFLTEPVLSALVREGHEVTLESRVPELVEGGPWNCERRLHPATGGSPEGDELLIDLDEVYERDPDRHVLHAYAQAAEEEVSLRVKARAPYLYLTAKEQEACAVYAHRKPYVLFHIRSRHYRRFRQVHGVDWGFIMDKVADHAGVARLRDDYPENRMHEVIPSPTLRAAIPAIFGASLFVGLDAAPAHMAASLGVPSIVLFGSVHPPNRYLPGSQVLGLSGKCIYAGCYHQAVFPELSKCVLEGERFEYCCTDYDPKQVLLPILSVLRGARVANEHEGLSIDGDAWWRQARRFRRAVR